MPYESDIKFKKALEISVLLTLKLQNIRLSSKVVPIVGGSASPVIRTFRVLLNDWIIYYCLLGEISSNVNFAFSKARFTGRNYISFTLRELGRFPACKRRSVAWLKFENYLHFRIRNGSRLNVIALWFWCCQWRTSMFKRERWSRFPAVCCYIVFPSQIRNSNSIVRRWSYWNSSGLNMQIPECNVSQNDCSMCLYALSRNIYVDFNPCGMSHNVNGLLPCFHIKAIFVDCSNLSFI